MSEVVSEQNVLLYAAKNYDNPQCFDTLEFYEDLARFKYIKKLLNRYVETGDLKERLIINHLVILYNVFGAEAATKLLFLKLNGYYSYIKPFLVFLGYMPDVIKGVGIDSKAIHSSDITMDENIIKILRKI